MNYPPLLSLRLLTKQRFRVHLRLQFVTLKRAVLQLNRSGHWTMLGRHAVFHSVKPIRTF